MQRIVPALLTAATFLDALRQSIQDGNQPVESNKATMPYEENEENKIQADDTTKEPQN